MPRVALHTLGCKLNYAETSTIGKQFLDRGFELVPFGAPAEVNVINTCSVTERADQECRQMIRRALRAAPDSYVIVTGCYAQLAPDEVAAIDGVDLVAGTKEKFDLLALAGDIRKLSCASVHVSSLHLPQTFAPAWTTEAGGRTRAFLKVQDGCDFSCSFCTIPRARGESRSQALPDTVRAAEELVDKGYKEIVLTGVNVGDYGKKASSSLAALLRSLLGVQGLERIRVSSIEPNLVTEEILDVLGSNSVLCNHLHIPLQSGSDRILGLMRRRYKSADYAVVIESVVKHLPECGIGADVIVGFPGESEADFEDTHRFLADLPLSYLHVFTYSERPGTPAMAMPEAVPPAVRSHRNAVLRSLGERKRNEFLRRHVGSTVSVLLESEVDDGLRFGFTTDYCRVGVAEEGTAENGIVDVRVEKVEGGYAIGKAIGVMNRP